MTGAGVREADSNDDGKIDISDPIHGLMYLFLGGRAPPAPWNVCGSDPTTDPISCLSFPGCLGR